MTRRPVRYSDSAIQGQPVTINAYANSTMTFCEGFWISLTSPTNPHTTTPCCASGCTTRYTSRSFCKPARFRPSVPLCSACRAANFSPRPSSRQLDCTHHLRAVGRTELPRYKQIQIGRHCVRKEYFCPKIRQRTPDNQGCYVSGLEFATFQINCNSNGPNVRPGFRLSPVSREPRYLVHTKWGSAQSRCPDRLQRLAWLSHARC